MQIPNSIIHIRCTDGRGYGPLIAPAYQAKVLRYVYRGKLDDAEGKGITVDKYPADGCDDSRYTEASDVGDELGRLRKLYKGDARGYYVDQAFTDKELEAEIVKMLEAEAERLTDKIKNHKVAVAHKSYLDAGVSEAQAIALQAAGFPTRDSCIGKTLMELNNVPGVDIATAKKLTLKAA